MSGGHFNGKQYSIGYIVDEIQEIIDNNENEDGDHFSKFTIKKFEKAIVLLRLAQIYAHRVDWLVSGDDGEDNFHKRLAIELTKLEEELRNGSSNK